MALGSFHVTCWKRRVVRGPWAVLRLKHNYFPSPRPVQSALSGVCGARALDLTVHPELLHHLWALPVGGLPSFCESVTSASLFLRVFLATSTIAWSGGSYYPGVGTAPHFYFLTFMYPVTTPSCFLGEFLCPPSRQ